MGDLSEVQPSVGNLMDSKTSHLDDLLLERFEQALHAETATKQLHEIARIAAEFSPIDLAHAASHLPTSGRLTLFDNLSDEEAQAQFLINVNRQTRSLVLRHLEDETICELVGVMPVDEAVDVLDTLPGRRLRRVVEKLDPERAANIRELLQYERRSAGRLMTNEFFVFTMEVTIKEAAKFMRDHPDIEFTRRLFVINEQGVLQGYVPARNLIINARDIPLRRVMQPIHHKVSPEATRDEVVDLVERYKIPALPVVEEGDILVGVITYEDVVEAIEDIADETIAQIAGTLEVISEHDSIIRRFFSRAPWLVVTLCGGLINAASISYFEGVLSPWLMFTLFFVPLITGMSGNVGVQCSTILVRSMATGELSAGSKGDAIAREISIGMLTAVIFGVLCGFVVYFLNLSGIQAVSDNPLGVAVIVGCGLFGACVTATFLGVFSPLFFARIGVDPAVASGPIVTAFNDVLSMVMYFLIAQLINVLVFNVV